MQKYRKQIDFTIFILSIYVLLEMSLEFVMTFSSRTTTILLYIDLVICFIFISEWLYSIATAKRPFKYAISHIFDLISAIPYISTFRFLRILRVFRFIRGFRGISMLYNYFNARPLSTALATYSVYMGVIFVYCSLAFSKYELYVNDKVQSFGDVIWLSFTTLTTIGYGDIYPSTPEGRFVAAVLVLTGAGFFALLSGEIATILIGYNKKNSEN